MILKVLRARIVQFRQNARAKAKQNALAKLTSRDSLILYGQLIGASQCWRGVADICVTPESKQHFLNNAVVCEYEAAMLVDHIKQINKGK